MPIIINMAETEEKENKSPLKLSKKQMTDLQQSLSKCRVEGNIVFLPPISEGKLANYNDVRKALMNAGSTYKKNAFVFPNDAQPYIDRLMEGESVNIKKEFQFFATPPALAKYLVDLADVKDGDCVLEPSAGHGAILKSIGNRPVHYCEIMDINKEVLKDFEFCKFICGDFLQISSAWEGAFEKIIANPPFSRNQDIDHIYKMYEVCKNGGRIVTVASKHWQFAKGKKETAFRNWLNEINAEIIDIPAGTFKESGTNISACIVVINKK